MSLFEKNHAKDQSVGPVPPISAGCSVVAVVVVATAVAGVGVGVGVRTGVCRAIARRVGHLGALMTKTRWKIQETSEGRENRH